MPAWDLGQELDWAAACCGERLGGGDGVVRADRAPVAAAGAAGVGPVDAVRLRAADGDLVVAFSGFRLELRLQKGGSAG